MKALFIADQFSDMPRSAQESHPGGAELTDEAALQAAPWPVTRRRWSDLDAAEISSFDVIVVANSKSARGDQLDAVAATGRHVLFEHDVRICRFNGNFPGADDPLHRSFQRCWCPHSEQQALWRTARGAIFLTRRQRAVYRQNPFFVAPPSRVLGCSLFGTRFFERVHAVREEQAPKSGASVVHSINSIKGHARSLAYARRVCNEVHVARDVSPERILDHFARAEYFVYLPEGLEPAGRMPVEARMLGCEVFVNAHVGVAGEAWWSYDGSGAMEFLLRGAARFWQAVEDLSSARGQRSEPLPPAWRSVAALANRIRSRRVKWPVLSPRVRRRAARVERHPGWTC